jgi:hypothetical protein
MRECSLKDKYGMSPALPVIARGRDERKAFLPWMIVYLKLFPRAMLPIPDIAPSVKSGCRLRISIEIEVMAMAYAVTVLSVRLNTGRKGGKEILTLVAMSACEENIILRINSIIECWLNKMEYVIFVKNLKLYAMDVQEHVE